MACLPALPAFSQGSPPRPAAAAAEATLAELLTRLDSPCEAAQARAREELSALGPDALPAVLELLFRPPERGGPPGGEPEKLLRERLRAWPAAAVADALVARARGCEADGLRALELLGELARAPQWPAVLAIGERLAADEVPEPRVVEALRRACAGLVRRDPAALRLFERSLGLVEPWLETPLAEALAESGRPQALPLVAELLGRSPALDERILCALGGWPRWSASHADCAALVEGYLRSPEGQVRRAAAATLGRLGAGRSLAALVVALEDPEIGVRRTALWALRQATGIEHLGCEAEWRRWLDLEERWLWERAPALRRSVLSGNANEAARAVAELGRHPWFASLAADLRGALAHPDAMVVKTACESLVALGGPAAVDGLLSLHDDARADVRAVAGAAFRSLTGRSWDELEGLDG